MALKTIFEMNDTQEQKIVQKLLETKSQSINVPAEQLDNTALKALEDKGYTITPDNTNEDATISISTGYDASKVSIKNLINNIDSDNLKCNNIPVAQRVRNYILKEQLKDMEPTIAKMHADIKNNIDFKIHSDDITNTAIFNQVIDILDLEIETNNNEYIISNPKQEKDETLNLDFDGLDNSNDLQK